jgi:CysZ protein
MIDAAVSTLSQMFSPPFRRVLLKSIGLALLLITLIGVGVFHLFTWLATLGQGWAEGTLGSGAHLPLVVLAWILSIAAGLGILVGSVFLMPAVAALVGSFFVDEIAEEVERTYYPADPPGRALPVGQALVQGTKTALVAVLVYLVAMPFLLFAGFGAVIFFVATAYLLSREYFELAAMRFRTPDEARRLRKQHQGTVFTAGLLIAGFVSIPVVNLAAPLFAMALMVHVHKRIAAAVGKVPARFGS